MSSDSGWSMVGDSGWGCLAVLVVVFLFLFFVVGVRMSVSLRCCF